MGNFAVRQPLLLRGAIALLLMGAVRLGIALGAIPPEWAVDETRVEQLLDAAIAAWAWWSARRVVTPVAAPRDHLGRPLAPAQKNPFGD